MNIYFNNFCPGFDEDVILTNIFVSFFSRVFCREISISKNFDNCEIMCESVFRSKPTRKTKYNFLYSGENILVPNIDQFDVVFSHISTFGKFVEFPLFMLYNEQMSKNHRQIQSKNLELKKNKVLCVIRNGSGTFRNKFLNVLDQYIQVDYAGNYRKNIESSAVSNTNHADQEYIEFMSEYKFVIAMENSYSEHGYITEKIINPLMAGVIPIYWGSKKIHDYFNPDRILTIENEDDFIPIVKKIKELMEDNQKYYKVVEQPTYQLNIRTLDTIVEETKKVITNKIKLINSVILLENHIKIFYHIYCNKYTEKVVEKQIQGILLSGLYEKVDIIHCFLAGEESFINKCKLTLINCGKKFSITAEGIDDKTYERFTLTKIKKLLSTGDKFLYIHSKGVSKPENKNVIDWINFMEYFLIFNHNKCLIGLDEYDTVGVNWFNISGYEGNYYDGNFWWTTEKYFKTLPDYIGLGYEDPQFYIGLGSPKVLNFFTTNINHYGIPCPPEYYIFPTKKEKLNCFKKVFCINLEHRTDRLNEFVLRYPCDRSQVEFFKAIDGKLINKYDLDIFETSLKNVKYSDGTLGCWISHYRIWNIISNDNGNDSELYAIFEDDAHFPDPENFKKTIESLAEFKDNFDIVYPGGTFEPFYNGKNDEMILVPELQNKIIKIYKQSKRLDRTTHFYILSKRGAKKILGLLDFSINAVDNFLKSLSLDRFEILPHLTYSPRDYKTDIQPPPMKIDVESYLTYRNNLKPGDKYY